MAYSISGNYFREIAERKFSADALQHSTGRDFNIPFVNHAVKHISTKQYGIISFKADFEKDVEIKHVTDAEHTSLHFQLNGSSKADFRDIKGQHPLIGSEHNIYFSKYFESNLSFKAQKGFEYLAITLKTDYLLAKISQFNNPVKRLETSLLNGESLALSGSGMSMTPELFLALMSLMKSPVPDSMSELFFDGKISEILALQLSQFLNPPRVRPINSEVKVMREIFAWIDENFLTINSLTDLAANFKLSESQIRAGLKRQYNCSLFQLIHRKRMCYAMVLLRETDMNVNEVAWTIGYSSASNFIQAFKKNFQLTPKAVSSKIDIKQDSPEESNVDLQ